MSERETDDRPRDAPLRTCSACGAANRDGDRFCAACGAPLAPELGSPGALARNETSQERESAAWIFGARPATVIVGGFLLLVLAAALLALGQRDDTGTIVMLSLCTAPLGLLILAIGIARAIAGAARRG
ncbi:MAG: zinc-ribbon domain-containing protein [Thermomicrobiales bacterium]